MIRLMQGDCLELMKRLPDASVDLILADLPYGTTACAWDAVIPFAPLWAAYRRVLKPNKAIVLTAQQPFTSTLIASNLSEFRYCWYWRKSRPGGFTNAKLKPLKDVEDVCVFSSGTTANGAKNNMPYFPQGVQQISKEWSRPANYEGLAEGTSPHRKSHKLARTLTATGYPRQVIDFANPNKDQVHPTQKPVDLMAYLIRTYSNRMETVLDNTMGSGTTGVAAIQEGRRFIGMEQDAKYFEIAKRRIYDEVDKQLDVV